MDYLEFFVAPVKTTEKDRFTEQAKAMAEALLRAGAKEVVDAWGTDVPEGEVTSLPMAVKLEADETVACGWIRWPSKAARDAGWEAVMAGPQTSDEMAFDGKRLIFGGFTALY